MRFILLDNILLLKIKLKKRLKLVSKMCKIFKYFLVSVKLWSKLIFRSSENQSDFKQVVIIVFIKYSYFQLNFEISLKTIEGCDKIIY